MADIERTVDLPLLQGARERPDDPVCKRQYTGVQQRRVLTFQQAHAPDVVRLRHAGARKPLLHPRGDIFFLGGIGWREHARDRDKFYSFRRHVVDCPVDLGIFQGRNGKAVVGAAAVNHVNIAAELLCNVLGPVDHRRYEFAGWQRNANDRGRRQFASLDHGVGKLCGADHDGVDCAVFNPACA